MRKTFAVRGVLLFFIVLGAGGAGEATASAQTAGINMGAPVWNGEVSRDALAAATGTGAAHVRVNFRLDAWSARPATPRR